MTSLEVSYSNRPLVKAKGIICASAQTPPWSVFSIDDGTPIRFNLPARDMTCLSSFEMSDSILRASRLISKSY